MKTVKIGISLVAILIVSLIAGATIYFDTKIVKDIFSLLGNQPTTSPTTQSMDSFFEKVKKVNALGGFEKISPQTKSTTTE